MSSYYDDKKKKYVVRDDKTGEAKEFSQDPGVGDYLKESLEPTNTRAQLEAIRRRSKTKG